VGGVGGDIDRCHIDDATVAKIGEWTLRHLRAAHRKDF
jgi:hypothetical protein